MNPVKLKISQWRFFDRDRLKVVFHPRRDWLVLLLVAAAGLFLISFFAYWVYFYFLERETTPLVGGVKLIDLKQLEEVVGAFETKEALFRKYYNNPPRLSDPY